MTRKQLTLRSVGRLPILALLLVAMATAPAKAAVFREWSDPAGGNYDDTSNWLTGDVADTIGEWALFDIAGTYDVALTSGATRLVGNLFVFDGDVTFKADGPTSAIIETDDDAGFNKNVTLTQGPSLGSVTLNIGDELQVGAGNTFNVLQGSDVTAFRIRLSGGNSGTMIVDGPGSTLAVSDQARIGNQATTGTLTFQNGSTGNSLMGSVELVSSSTQAGSTGRLNVFSGSTLQTGDITVGLSSSASAVQEATLTVDGTNSILTMAGASTLTIGDDINPNVVSDVIVSNSGVMSTGTGAILIQNSGHLDIQNGTFNANGDMAVDGATVTRGSGSSDFNLGSGVTLTATNAAQINFTGSHSIDQGSTFDIQSGASFDTTGSLNIGDAGGNGTLIVDGTGSSVSVGSDSTWGSAGNTADVTFRNDAFGGLGVTHLAADTTGGTTGNLNVESGALLWPGTITVAASGGATTSGTITVDGVGSILAQTGSSDLTVGHASSGTATINVQNGGTFATGSGTTIVNATGSINIGGVGSAGLFHAKGNITVDGGTITRGTGVDDFNLTAGNTLTAKNDAQINFGGFYRLDEGTTLDIQLGADFSSSSFLDIGTSAGDGTLLVDGAGSSVTTGAGASLWGLSGNTADVTFRNGATGDLGGLDLATSTAAGTTSIFRVESGAAVTTNGLNIVTNGGATTSGTVTVDGPGSSLTHNGFSDLIVGHAANGTATIDVQNSGTYSTGTNLNRIHNTGTINVSTGGTINLLGNNLELDGTINVLGGGIFNTNTGLTTVSPTGADGEINIGIVDPGTFNANGNLTLSQVVITRGSGSGDFNLGSGLTLTAQNFAQIDFGGAYSIDQGNTFDIQSSADFDTTGSLDIGDAGGDGTLIVDGLGSQVTSGNASSWGSSGNTADVTFRATASGILSGISLANDTTSGTTGIFNVESGAIVTAGNLDIAASGGATTSGTITVDNATLAQEGTFDLVVGHATSGTATINIQNDGTFSTGTSSTTVNPTGAINIGVVGGGTLNVTSDITVDGGTITRDSGAIGFNLTPGNTLTAKNGGQINFGGDYYLDQGTTFDIQSGADFSTTGFLDIGGQGVGDATLLVDGAGSSVTTGPDASVWGNFGYTADVTFRNAATGDLGRIYMVLSSGTTGIFNIESGASVTTDRLRVTSINAANSSGTITVDGVGSSLTQNGGSDLTVGNASMGTATINVQNSGTFTTGTGLATIDTTGTVNVNTGGTFNLMGDLDIPGTFNLVGGTLTAVDPVVTSGSLNFVFGTVELNSNQALDLQRLAGLDVESLEAGKTFRVNGVATLLTPLTLAGGTFATESLVNPFLLDFQTGTFQLTSDNLMIGSTGLFGSSVTVAASQTYDITNTATVDAGATLAIETGGTFKAGTFVNNGFVTGDGILGGNFTNSGTGVVQVSSGQSLNFTGATNTNAGTVRVLGGSVEFAGTLANTTDGNILGRGTMIFGGTGLINTGDLALSNGQTDVFGDVDNQSTGRMMVSGNADVTFWDDVADSGTLFNVSAGSSATFFGTAGFGISGGGDVFFEADVTPGNSPGLESFGGNVYFGTLANLQIELSGLTPGSEFDVLDIAGTATLGGILDLSLINGFTPGLGDTFQFITASSIVGNFASISGSDLGGGLAFDVLYSSNDVTLSVISTLLEGDLNADGFVGIADLNIVLGVWNTNVTPGDLLAGDPSGDGFVGIADLNVVLGNWNAGIPPSAGSNVIPEPGSGVLLCTGVVTMMRGGRRRLHSA